jgi:formate dehydrogenase subunit gamma
MLNTPQLDEPETQIEEIPGDRAHVAASEAPADIKKASGTAANPKILRFAKSERIVHWAIAGPFLVSFATAIILVVIYNPDSSRPFRSLFAGLHRASGVALIVLPMLAALKSRGDARIHFYNVKQAWTWVYDDFKWLALMGLAAVNSKIRLPEQGKFNAAEKLNFMVLMTTYPLYVATGLLMWLTHLAILSWILHFVMAMLATPLLLGHLFMALINRSSRPGLQGMISGFVDRHWAKHHYRRWYREHHETALEQPSGERREGPCAAMVPVHDAVDPEVVSPAAISENVTLSSTV